MPETVYHPTIKINGRVVFENREQEAKDEYTNGRKETRGIETS